jgi:hypothetical protein
MTALDFAPLLAPGLPPPGNEVERLLSKPTGHNSPTYG